MANGETYLFEDYLTGFVDLFQDGTDLYTNSSLEAHLSVLAGQYEVSKADLPAGVDGYIAPPLIATVVVSESSKRNVDNASSDSPWYVETVIRNNTNGREYRFDLRGTAWEQELDHVLIPLTLSDLLAELGIPALPEYDAQQKALIFHMGV